MGILGDIFGLVDDTITTVTDNLHLTSIGAKENKKIILEAYRNGEITKEKAEELLERHVTYY